MKKSELRQMIKEELKKPVIGDIIKLNREYKKLGNILRMFSKSTGIKYKRVDTAIRAIEEIIGDIDNTLDTY